MATILDVENLSRRFGGLKAVDELSFSVEQGEILGIIGPNGAGKTTAVNLVSGLIPPTSGRVTFQGETITGLAPHALVEKGLVRTFQATTVWTGCTVRENALRGAFRHLYPGFFATFLDTARARQMRAKANAVVDDLLASLSLTDVADQIADSLPYGYQKTLGMVIALAAAPRLVLLDEPAAGLSAEEADHVRDTILKVRQRGISVVVIDHNMRFIKGLCDRVLVIHQGRELAVGKPTDVLANAKVIEAYLGTYDAAPQG